MGLDIKLGKTNWGFKGKNYLFLIAIDNYKHWTPLKCAKNDVKKFARILKSKYQFEDKYITYLPDSKASLRNILTAFRNFADIVTEDDNLIIYFSGHGHYISGIETGYWIPQNAHLEEVYEDEFINTVVIVDKLRAIKSLHTFLIVDACFSGSLLRTKKGAVTRSEQHRSRRIFTSGRADELVDDGPENGHSPFAIAILDKLISNTDRYISASRLIVEVKGTIKSNQTPEEGRIGDDDDGGDFVFHVKLNEDVLWAQVVQSGDKEAYRKFAEQFPNSVHHAEALDTYDWLTAAELNTIDSLSNYFEKYRGRGKYIHMAMRAFSLFDEESHWGQAKSKNTHAAYLIYLVQFPAGKYAAIAEDMIAKFRGKGVDKVLEKAIEEITHRTDPNVNVSPEEENAWNDTKKNDTFISYQNFCQSYADSKFISLAKKRMNDLDKMASNSIQMGVAAMNANHATDTKEMLPKLKGQITRCMDYFQQHPGGPNNKQIKQIKDRLEIRMLNLLK